MRILLAPILALALILQGGSAAAQFSLFNLRNSLVQFALDKLSVPGSFEIEAEGVARDEDGFTELVGVTIADSEGVWLQADAVILSWNVSRVLRGQLVINRLGARGVDVLRAPNPASLPEAEVAEEVEEPPAQAGLFGFDWPRAPITTIVEELVLDDVEIAPGVIAEQGVAFDATGSASDIGDTQAVDLNVQRNDALEGEIFLDYLRNFETNELTLDLEATEEAGGLVASILGLPEESASQVSLYADGPLDDWRLALRAEGEDLLDVQAQAEIDLIAPVSVALTATVTPGEALDPQVAAAISPFVRVALVAEEGEAGRIVIQDAAIQAPGIDFGAEGYYERPTGAVSLDIALLAEEGISDLVGGVDFDRFGFEGEVRGALDDLTASGELTLAGLATEAVDVGDAALQASISRAGERIGFDVAGEITGLRLDRLTAETVGAVELAAVGAYDGATLSLERFVFDSPLLTAEAEGTVGASPAPEAAEAEGPTALTYALRAPELRPIAEAYDVEASGAAAIEGRASGALDAPRLVGEAALRDVTYQGETYGTVALEHDVTLGATPGGRVALTASGSPYGPAEVTASFRLEDQLLTLSEFEAEAVGAALEGELAVALDSYLADGRVAFRIVDLATLEAQAGLALEGDASGVALLESEAGEQTVAVEATGANVRGFDYALESFAIDATVRQALSAPQGEGVATLSGLSGPDDLALGSARFEGEAALVDEALVAEGVLTAEAISAAGATVDAVRLEGAGTDLLAAPAAEATLTVEGVAYPAAEARVARLTFEGSARDLLAEPSAEGVLTAEGVEAAGATVASLTLRGEGRSLIESPAVDVTLTTGEVAYPAADAVIGEVRFEGTGRNLLEAPALVGEAALEEIVYQGEAFGRVALEHDVTLGATPEGRVALTAAGSPYGPAEVTASFRLEDQLLTLSGFEAEAVGAALEGELAVALDSYLADGRVAFRIVDLATLEAQAGLALEGDASGVALLESEAGEQTVAVEATGANVRGFDYALESFAIDATVRQALSAPQGEGVFTLTNLEGPAAAIESIRLEGEAALVDEALVANGVLTAEAVRAAGATVDALRLEATGEDLIEAPRAELALTVEGAAYPAAEARITRLTFEGAARDLLGAPAAEGELTATGIEAAEATVGAVTATFEGRSLIEEPAVELAVTALDIAYPPAEAKIGVARFEGSASDLYGAAAAEGVLTADGVTAGEATGGALRLAFEGEQLIDDPVVQASLTVENLAYPPAEARIGALSFEGTARDLYSAPSAEGVLTAEGIEAAEARVGALTARFDGETLIENPSLDLALTAEDVAYPPADARLGSLSFEGSASDLLTSPNAQGELTARGIAAAGATVGALEARFQGENLLDAPSGTLEATVSDVAAAGFAAGQARLEATARQAGGGLVVDAGATAGPVTGDGVSIGSVVLDATVADALSATPRIDAEARASAVQAAGYDVASLTASADGPLSALDLAVDATGTTPQGEPLDLGLRARADLGGENISATVTALDARAGTLEARLAGPARISLGEATRIDDLRLEALGATVEGDVALYPTGIVGDLTVSAPRLAPVAELAELPIQSGSLIATAAFDTRRGSAGADVDIALRDLVPEAIEDVPGGLDITAQADWDGARLVAEAAVSGPFERPVLAEFALPLRPTAGLIPAPPEPAPIEGSLRWTGRLGDLWALVPVPDLILDGDARIALAFDGTLEAPEIAGDVALTDGTAQYLTTGTILTDFTITSALMPGGAFRVSARATDGAGSPVTAEVVIADGAIDAEVAAREAVLVRRDDVTASITAGLDIEGPLVSPAIRGDVFIDRAEVRLVDATPPSVATLGDVRIIGEPLEEETDAGEDGVIPLSIDVRGEQIFVRGRGLDSQWRIELDVGGTASQPILVGAVEAVRGRLSLIGFPFDLTRGRVIFDGGPEIDPRLDVALFRENDGVIGGLVVTGYASEPQLGFESTPALPESEVLPRVLFGTSTQSLSTGQAIQLAAGIATLLGGGGGPVDAVRAATGLDVLRFDQEGGQAGVTVGRNISDDVFVGARQPIEGGSATVTVEIEVFDNVTVDTEIGVEAGSSVGLSWKKDF